MLAANEDLTRDCEAMLLPGEEILLTAEARGTIVPGYKQALGQIFLTTERIIWVLRKPPWGAFRWRDGTEVIQPETVSAARLVEGRLSSLLVLKAEKTYQLMLGRVPDLKFNCDTTRTWYAALAEQGYRKSNSDGVVLRYHVLDPKLGKAVLILYALMAPVLLTGLAWETPLLLSTITVASFVGLIASTA